MFSSSHIILALVLSLPLFALGIPTKRSQYSLPSPLAQSTLALVRKRASQLSTHSWEIGTLAEALTELEWPQLSVFASGSIPPPSHLTKGEAKDVLAIAEKVVKNKPAGQLPLIDGAGATGDPASIGVAVLLRNRTLPTSQRAPYASAAKDQLDYLLNVAPRAADGTISTRESEVQLWSDFVYMAPPFIAYYGALEGGSTGATLLQTAYDQVRLYRAVLFDQGVGLWRHIALGSWSDPTHWATGNAWAAAGVLRVLATIKHSPEAGSMQSQQSDLAQWAGETLTGVWKYQQANGTLLNYLDQPNSFADSSSTALLAAATFRYASITGDNSHIPAAIKALQLVQDSVSKTGYLLNTVNPETFSTPSGPGQHSPEGQSFVLLLEAAVSAWKSQNNQ